MDRTLHHLLTAHRDAIVARFVSEVERNEISPPAVSRSRLIDHIPLFLDEIIAELAHGTAVRFTQEVADQSPIARRHGQQRWSIGYDLEALMREYGILRHAILETARASAIQLTNREFDVLAKCLSVGVSEAVMAYVRHHDAQVQAQKANLEFLSLAGQLLASSLDHKSTFASVTRLIVPRLADWCAIYIEGFPLDESPIAHVMPEKIEVLREILQRFPSSNDTRHGFPDIVRTGEPRLIEQVAPGALEEIARSPEHLSLLRRISSRSWIVVPLSIQSGTFGAITLAWSESACNYNSADLPLVEELARRAAVAIDNARLYDLSQKERSRVEAAMRAKDEFVATVSHELRTPLHAILGWIRLIRSGTLTEAKRLHAIEVIERNASAQNQLVTDLLDISRAITGRIRINPSQVDLSNVIDITLEDAQLALEAKRIEVHTDLERARAVMRGDAERLQQVVWSLLTNAIKFTPKGGEIWVDLRRVESDLELIVRDTGVGIDASFLPHVFETFRQSDSSVTRAHGGLGIGLSITQHLVDLHGGSIEARSAGVGKGAVFVVRLPISALVLPALGVAKVPATKQYTPSPEPLGLAGTSVLVVDDERDARELVSYLLETFGMEVRMAASVEEAMKALETFTPRVIISDIGMPGEDGYALIRSIRTMSSDEKRDIPAIALTAFAHSEDRTRVLVAGFNRYLVKPVEPTLLVKAVVDLTGN